MSGELYARAKELFTEAREVAQPERDAFLRARCGSDAALFEEVVSLLAGDDTAVLSSQPPLRPADASSPYAGRYELIELLGAGGMGQVHRAHDRLLDVVVALKRVTRRSPLERTMLRNEVRLAREVTHPSVCRVFDVGESGEELFFTMEYVSGEDLGSLIRRVGRLSPDRAGAIAQQLLSGLAAAHARGVLHCDLKPANVMIDRNGDAKLTDFGIAKRTDTAGRSFAGTPAYMAPEQLRGAPPSIRSDLFAAGLIIYEMITGRPAFDDPLHRGSLRPASDEVAGLDGRMDAAIARVLSDDPELRPSSAVELASIIPGIDPLPVAVAAGQTPSPEIVASAGSPGALRPAIAWSLLGAIGAGVLVIVAADPGTRGAGVVMSDPPAVVEKSARLLVEEVTHRPAKRFRAFAAERNEDYEAWRSTHQESRVDAAQYVRFLYRDSPAPLVPAVVPGASPDPTRITASSPAMTLPGMATVTLDGRGRLRRFELVPEASAAGGAVDWAPLLRATGADPASLRRLGVAPVAQSLGDETITWRGRLAGGDDVSIEGTAYRGVPIRFEVVEPWRGSGAQASSGVAMIIGLALLGVAALLAAGNLHTHRADRRGAQRLALTVFALLLLSSILRTSFLPVALEIQRTALTVATTLLPAVVCAAIYLALEPFVRRRWPESLISWSRLLGGQHRDPRIGRDVLVGAATSIVGTAVYFGACALLPSWFAHPPVAVDPTVYLGTRYLLSGIVLTLCSALTGAIGLVFFFTALVAVSRRVWIAASILSLLLIAATATGASLPELVVVAIAQILAVVVFVRFGLVALVSLLFFDRLCESFPLALTGDWRSEFAVTTIAVITIVSLVAFTLAREAPSPAGRGFDQAAS